MPSFKSMTTVLASFLRIFFDFAAALLPLEPKRSWWREPYLMRDAIGRYSDERRDHQGQSRAIKGHQGPSRAIRSHQEPSRAIKSHQEPSRAIKGHQEPSRAIKSHQEPSRAIKGHQGPSRDQEPSRAIQIHQEPSSAIKSHPRAIKRSRAIKRHQAPSGAVPDAKPVLDDDVREPLLIHEDECLPNKATSDHRRESVVCCGSQGLSCPKGDRN